MAASSGPDIVDSGLVLAFDAADRKTFANSVINSTSWSLGAGGATGYNQNGATAENERVTGTDPFGRSATVWETRPQGNNADDGGWNSDWFNIDNTKLHRFSVWVKRTTDTSGGTFYLGLYGNGTGIRRTDNNAVEGNPYWDCRGTIGFTKDVWYLVVGHCYPYNTTYTGQNPESGIYTVAGGATKVLSINACNIGADVKWAGADVTQTIHRCYHYYCADSTTRLQLFDPRIDVIDGTEPSITNLLSGFTANRLTDLIGTNNGTFVNGPTYSSANRGSIVFDGTNDYVSIPLSTSLNKTQGTMNFWVYPTRYNGSNGYFVNRDDSTANAADWLWIGPYSDTFYFRLGNGSDCCSNDLTFSSVSSVIPLNSWTNMCFTWVSNGTSAIYKNGTLYTSRSIGNVPSTNPSLTGRIGLGHGGNGDEYFAGRIANTSIYTRALTAAEISQNFNATRRRFGI